MASEMPGTWERNKLLGLGEDKLRSHLPAYAPIKLTLIYGHEYRKWEVLTEFRLEGVAPLLIGREDLEAFPSDTLIAQAMLVA
jgi:hypothetical protein